MNAPTSVESTAPSPLPEAPKGRDKHDSVRALDRALSILEVIAARPEGASLTAVAGDLCLPLSTTHRLLTTLETRGFVALDRRRMAWRIGRTAAWVGANFIGSRDLVSAAAPIMRSAAHRLNEVINLGVIADGRIVFVHRVDPRCRRPFAPSASPLPIHSTGIGKALLACAPQHELQALAARPLEQVTRHTITRPDALAEDLRRSRESGFAVDNEENTMGLRCVAAPIFDERGTPVAALSVAQTIARVRGGRPLIEGERVRAVAAEITRAYGGRAPEALAPTARVA